MNHPMHRGVGDAARLPLLNLGSRHGVIGLWLKRIVARLIRFEIVYQGSVNELLQNQIRDLARRTDASERSLDMVRAAMERVTTLETTLIELRGALAVLATSTPQRFADLESDTRFLRGDVSELQHQQHTLKLEMANILTAAADLRRRVDEALANGTLNIPSGQDHVLEITQSRVDETVVRYAEISEAPTVTTKLNSLFQPESDEAITTDRGIDESFRLTTSNDDGPTKQYPNGALAAGSGFLTMLARLFRPSLSTKSAR